MKTDSLTYLLDLSSRSFSITEVAALTIQLRIQNGGKEPKNTEHHLLRLLVNGKASIAFMLTVGNGHRGPEWFSLPPGGEIRKDLSSIAQSIFTSTGKYDLQLQLLEQTVCELDVEVTE